MHLTRKIQKLTKKHPQPLVVTGAAHAINWHKRVVSFSTFPPKSPFWVRQLKKGARWVAASSRLPHSPTAKGGPTLHGGWAYLHGGQSPISPQLKTNVLPPPAVFSCGNRNGGDEQDPGTSDRDDHKSVFNCFSHSFRIHFIKLRPCQHQCTKPVFLQSFLVD